MLRTLAISTLISGAPIAYILNVDVSPRIEFAAITISLLIPVALIVLIDHTRRRMARGTFRMLSNERTGEMLDRILSEAERLSDQRAGRSSRK